MRRAVPHARIKARVSVLMAVLLVLTAICATARDADAKHRKDKARKMHKVHKVSATTVVELPAPTLLPGTKAEMNAAGYWIARHPYPDRVIMSEEEIRRFNEEIRRDLNVTHDLATHPSTAAGAPICAALQQDIAAFSPRKYFLPSGEQVDEALLRVLADNMAIGRIPAQIKVRFGFITAHADLRRLPTTQHFYPGRESRSANFDLLQETLLDVGTPIAVLQTSADGKWHYIAAPQAEGWVEDEKTASCPFELMKGYLQSSRFVVVTVPRGELYRNEKLTAYAGRLKMGARLPLVREINAGIIEVTIPQRASDGSCAFVPGYLDRQHVHVGYLSYTPRHALLQAFTFLNEPYGWGDTNGEQDCSSFVRSIFATMGIELPRNSGYQARTGRSIAVFTRSLSAAQRREVIKTEGVGGITLFGMKGHIMLYLGTDNEVPYVIHASWSYREKTGENETVRIVARVAVTSLLLGEATLSGSLLEKIETVRLLAR